MKRHHLHQTARADKTLGVRIELGILGEDHADKKRGIDFFLPSLNDDR